MPSLDLKECRLLVDTAPLRFGILLACPAPVPRSFTITATIIDAITFLPSFLACQLCIVFATIFTPVSCLVAVTPWYFWPFDPCFLLRTNDLVMDFHASSGQITTGAPSSGGRCLRVGFVPVAVMVSNYGCPFCPSSCSKIFGGPIVTSFPMDNCALVVAIRGASVRCTSADKIAIEMKCATIGVTSCTGDAEVDALEQWNNPSLSATPIISCPQVDLATSVCAQIRSSASCTTSHSDAVPCIGTYVSTLADAPSLSATAIVFVVEVHPCASRVCAQVSLTLICVAAHLDVESSTRSFGDYPFLPSTGITAPEIDEAIASAAEELLTPICAAINHDVVPLTTHSVHSKTMTTAQAMTLAVNS